MEDVFKRLCWFFGTVQESCREIRDRREEKPARIVVEHSRESIGPHGLSVSCLDHKH